MKLTLKSDEGGLVRVVLSGEISRRHMLPADDPLTALLGPECYGRRVLLDLHEVRMLDSGGVGWLLGCQKRFRARGGEMVLHTLSPMAREILRVLKMHLVFRMAEDEQSACTLAEQLPH